ncbi:unnamed protein product [Caenorhabditis angaria]|uniref:Uncharacterized protein n=1 Tax=Caenorhabditis angaria TaxID=860376 RepID=A0A9P1N0D4_9PELO|nr:unnamed protein product [Caenorhabditis angaria]
MSYRFGYYNSDTGEDYDPAYTIDEQSLDYLDGMFIKGVQIRPLFTRILAKKSAKLSEFTSNIVSFMTRHPEMSHIGIGEQIASYQDSSRTDTKYITPYVKLMDAFWQKLGASENLRTLAFARIEYDGTENVPSNVTRNLKSIGLYDVSLTANQLPTWISGSNIQFLDILSTVNDSTDVSAWDNLENLEHFMLRGSRLTNIKSLFLAKSTQLISLTLQCNDISVIQENAFDHLVNLKFLNIAGNYLQTLPDQIFMKLTNLLVFDVRALDIDSKTILNFDDNLVSCHSGSSLNSTFYLNSVPKLPNPENLKVLEVRGQKNFDKSTFEEYENVEILNIGFFGYFHFDWTEFGKIVQFGGFEFEWESDEFDELDW